MKVRNESKALLPFAKLLDVRNRALCHDEQLRTKESTKKIFFLIFNERER